MERDTTRAALLGLLRLQMEWGADEALQDAPADRLGAAPPARATAPEGTAAAGPAAPRAGAVARAVAVAAAASSLDALRLALAAFDGCTLAVTATSLVFADGNPDAGLVVVGDCPGAEEDRTGRPFSGPAGQFLDRMLGSIGVDRTTCLMTLLVPWRPPGDRPASAIEIETCRPFLLRHLELLRPRRLLLLGEATARALTGTAEPIARLRGRWHDVALPSGLVVPALAMQAPRVTQIQADAKRRAWADLLMLRAALTQS